MGERECIEEQAAEWIARRDSAHWNDAQETQLKQWLESSSAHAVAFARLQAMWQQANRLRAIGAGVPPGVMPRPGELRSSPYFDATNPDAPNVGRGSSGMPASPRRRLAGRAAGWSAVAAASCAVAALVWQQGLFARTHYVTPVGGTAEVSLPDGSAVILNTDSDIRLAVSATERRIDLRQGEAFFNVAPDSTRPFVVTVAGKRVVAVGTAFSVRRHGTEIDVVVTSGAVRVEQASGGRREPLAQLKAGSVARAGDAAVTVQQRSLPEVEELLSWRSGFIVFRETRLADAVTEFNRYNGRRIYIEDPAVADIRIGGKFRATNIESFIGLLREGFPVRVQVLDERIVLTAR